MNTKMIPQVVTGEPKRSRGKPSTPAFHELPLRISLEDLPGDTRNALSASRAGDRLLGGGEEALQAVYDELPGVIARRLKRITPADFRIAKVTLKLQLDVNIPGVKVGGTVDVTLEPTQTAPAGKAR